MKLLRNLSLWAIYFSAPLFGYLTWTALTVKEPNAAGVVILAWVILSFVLFAVSVAAGIFASEDRRNGR